MILDFTYSYLAASKREFSPPILMGGKSAQTRLPRCRQSSPRAPYSRRNVTVQASGRPTSCDRQLVSFEVVLLEQFGVLANWNTSISATPNYVVG